MEEAPQTAPQGQVSPVQGPSMVKPHRGGAVLALGILGIATSCFILGIIAWVMGSSDLKEMDAGTRDRSGYSLTKAGMICGIVSTCLVVLWILWFIFIVALGGAMGALG